MPEWLQQRARLSPDRPAVIFAGEEWTFAELEVRVTAAARCLSDAGVNSGDAVALLAKNSAAFVVAVHAVARRRAVLVPLNARLAVPELHWQLKNVEASFLVHDEANDGTAKTLCEQLPDVSSMRLSDLVGQPNAASSEPSDSEGQIDLSTVHSIVHTSGTTGRPKGAMLTYGNHLWSAIGSMLNLGLRPDDRWLACLPLFHVGGLAILLRSLIYGMPVVVHEAFDAHAVNETINRGEATIVSVVSTMLQRMLDAQGERSYPTTLRCVLVGGGPVSASLLEACVERGVPVVQTYGLTEAASQVATLAPEDALQKVGSAGKSLFPTELRIVGEDGRVLPTRSTGEITVRGPTVMAGYYGSPDATGIALTDGWLHTGDVGYLDEEGYLYVLDRRDDLIVSGGENVYPAEVEEVLASHPSVDEAGVAGVTDEQWGQTVAATVTLREGEHVSVEELLTFCRSLLAAYKVPTHLRIAGELPRDVSGKLLRRVLREGW